MARRRRGNLTPVGSIAQNVLGERVWERAKTQYLLDKIWREAVGDFVAKHSQVKGYRGRSLIVVVDDHSLMNNLHLMTPGILEQVNDRLEGRLRPFKKILFQWGEIEREEPEPSEPEEQPQLTPEQRERVEETLEGIKDPELREITRRVLERAMAREGD